MNTLPRAAAVIRRAEQELRGLITDAASGGEYDALATLAEWAKQLAALNAVLPPSAEDDPSVLPALAPIALPTANGALAPKATTPKATPGKLRKSEYPKFLRQGDELVKIGWSKSEKAPYEHKAPRAVVTLLIQALIKIGQDGRVFTMDALLPLRQTRGVDVPSYQAYVALAWLRTASLIVQHGRRGYSLIKKVDLAAEAERRWNELPSR
jgi:hypothetical protein